MKVILLKDIESLGRKNEVKEVADGHARNFLLPNKLAAQASEKALAELETKQEELAKQAEEDLERTQQIISELDGFELEIPAKVSDDKKLYGAIGPAQISSALKTKGFDVPKQYIKLGEPIKETGESEILLEFPHGLEAKIQVIVLEEK